MSVVWWTPHHLDEDASLRTDGSEVVLKPILFYSIFLLDQLRLGPKQEWMPLLVNAWFDLARFAFVHECTCTSQYDALRGRSIYYSRALRNLGESPTTTTTSSTFPSTLILTEFIVR